MTIEADVIHYLNRLKYPKLNLTLQPDLTTLISTIFIWSLTLRSENQAKRLTQYYSSMDCATALLQQSLSNAVHTYLSTLSILPDLPLSKRLSIKFLTHKKSEFAKILRMYYCPIRTAGIPLAMSCFTVRPTLAPCLPRTNEREGLEDVDWCKPYFEKVKT
jgi:hypothetical protein